MIRATAVTQALAGTLLLAAAGRLLAAAAPVAPAADAGSAEAAAASAKSVPFQTPLDTEPPASVGAAWDSDASLPEHARRVASYTLEARLNEEQHTVDGHGSITWENASNRPAAELYFHLYLNAFKNNQTLFLRSPFGAGRSGRGARKWGYIDVARLSVREMGGADVWPHGHESGEDDPNDETDVRVPLPRPVAPGERITLDVEWKSQLPEIVERTGYMRDFHMVGQWFPKLARRESSGTWSHFPFHAQSEFYSDFGSYDVTLDVASGLVVGATGEKRSEDVGSQRKKVRYSAHDVHDFAWTAWSQFKERSLDSGGVEIRVLFPPGNEGNAAATLEAMRKGLDFYGKAFGRYPYPTLTVVHPPAWASAAGGMEYPTLITTGGPWFAYLGSTFVERVALHELGHQWFYGLVATDEHSWPFLDEGLTTYAESAAMHALFGDGNGFDAPGLVIDGDAYLRGYAVDAGEDDIVARPAADFANFREIGALVYARTGIVLETLARVYGREGLRRAIGRYARRYRFEHPGPKHLVGVVREVLGDDAADTLSLALFEGGTVDFVARDLQSLPAREKAGVFDRGGARETRTAKEGGRTTRWVSRVLVFRHGRLRIPTDIELHFEDGTTERRHWDGRDRFKAFDAEGSSPLVAAVVDPDTKVLLDDDLTNNAVRKGVTSAPRVVERGVYAAELALGALGQ